METVGVASELRTRAGVRVPGDVLVHLRAARDEIDRHFAEPIDLDRVAAVAGFSKFHFHRLFTATYGVTPTSYLTRRRIGRAQDLLRPVPGCFVFMWSLAERRPGDAVKEWRPARRSAAEVAE